MMMKRWYVAGLFLLFLVLPFGASAFASTYSQVISFGDSLSDNGNADGYGFGVWSNGRVWVDYLAESLGVGLLDLAYGGAQSNYHPNAAALGFSSETFGFRWQIDQYLTSGAVDTNALYTVWIGGNDLLNITSPDTAGAVIGNAITNIFGGIYDLIAGGAQNILVMNMPNLGATPLMNQDPSTAGVGAYLAGIFNASLWAALDPYRSAVNLMEVDVFALMNKIIAGNLFDNDTEMLSAAGATNDTYLFWDAIHPTTDAHRLIAGEAFRTVVPEPGTILLFSLGLLGVAGLSRRKNY